MDPNETLRRIRILQANYAANPVDGLTPNQVEDLIDLTEALDAWLSKGGFLPQAWMKGRK